MPDGFYVIDSGGTPLPTQAKALTRWWADDGSIRNLSVTFLASVPAYTTAGTGTATYSLAYSSQPPSVSAARPVSVTSDSDSVYVQNGRIRLKLNKRSNTVLSQVWRDTNSDGVFSSDEAMLYEDSSRAILTDASGGAQDEASRSDIVVSVEESGPVRATIKISAPSFLAVTNTLVHGFAFRIYVYANSDTIRLDYRIENAAKNTQYSGPLYFDQFLINLVTAVNTGSLRTSVGMGDGTVKHASGPLSTRLSQDFHNSFSVVTGTVEPTISNGSTASGFVDVSDDRMGITVFARHFWQMWPNAIQVTPSGPTKTTVALLPFPATSAQWYKNQLSSTGLYWLNDMQSVGKQFYITFHQAGVADADLISLAKNQEYGPVGVVPYSYRAKSQASLPLGGYMPPNVGAAPADQRLPNDRAKFNDPVGNTYPYGAMIYGSWDPGYRDQSCTTGGWPYSDMAFFVSGNPSDFYTAEGHALGELNSRASQYMPGYSFGSDYPQLQLTSNPYCGDSWRRFINSSTSKYLISYLPGTGEKANPRDDEHAWFEFLEQMYCMTGEPAILDYLLFCGQFRRTRLYQLDPFPNMDGRAAGHTIANAMQAYRATGDKQILALVRDYLWKYIRPLQRPLYGDQSGNEGSYMMGYVLRPMCEWLAEAGDSDPQGFAKIFSLASGFVEWNYTYGHFASVDAATGATVPSNPNFFTLVDATSFFIYHYGIDKYNTELRAYVSTGINGGSKPYVVGTPWQGGYEGRLYNYIQQTAKTKPSVPDSVTQLVAQRTSTGIQCSWKAPSTSARFIVYWATKPISLTTSADSQQINWWAAEPVAVERVGGEDQSASIALPGGTSSKIYVAVVPFDQSRNMGAFRLADTQATSVYRINGTTTRSGVTVSLTGPVTATSTTNSAGEFSFTVPPGVYSVTPTLSGTVFVPSTLSTTVTSSDVTVAFSVQASNYLVSGNTGQPGATVTLSGSGSQSTTADAAGQYQFTVSGGTYTITPSMPGRVFKPASSTVVVSANVSANFSADLQMLGVAVARNADGRLEMFGRASSNQIYHKWELAPGTNSWSEWQDTYGQTLGVPALAVDTAGRLGAVVWGTDNHLYRTVQTGSSTSTSMTGWRGVSTAGTIVNNPGMVATPAGFAVGYSDSAGLPHLNLNMTGTADGQDVAMGGIKSGGDITLSLTSSGCIVMHLRGQDGILYRAMQTTNNGAMASWKSTGLTMSGNAAVGRNPNGLLLAIARGPNNLLQMSSQLSSGDSWGPWTVPSGGTTSGSPVAASDSSGAIAVFGMGVDSPSRVWWTRQTSPGGGQWTAWAASTLSPSSLSGVALNATGILYVFSLGADKAVQITSTSGWTLGNPVVTTYRINGTTTRSGVTVSLTGPVTATSTTNSAGEFSFTVPPGVYSVTPTLSGTVFVPSTLSTTVTSSDVTVAFSVQASNYLVSGNTGQPGATVTLSGSGSQSTTADAAGQYQFTVSGGTYTITPSMPGRVFKPASSTVVVSANVSANFSADLQMLGVAVARNADGRLEMFGRASSNQIYHKWELAPGTNSWSEWQDTYGQTLGVPALAVDTAGRLGAVVWGTDNHLYRTVQTGSSTSTSMTGWRGVSTAGTIVNNPGMVATPAGFAVGYSDSAGLPHLNLNMTGTADGQDVAMGGIKSGGDITLSLTSSGCIVMHLRGQDGILYRAMQTTNNGAMASWKSTGLTMSGNAAVGRNPNGLLLAIARGPNNLLQMSSQLSSGDSWGPWTVPSGGTTSGSPVAASDSSGAIAVFGMGVDSPSRVWWTRQTSPGGGQWTAWAASTLSPSSLSGVALNATGILYVFSLGADKAVQITSTSGWTLGNPLVTKYQTNDGEILTTGTSSIPAVASVHQSAADERSLRNAVESTPKTEESVELGAIPFDLLDHVNWDDASSQAYVSGCSTAVKVRECYKMILAANISRSTTVQFGYYLCGQVWSSALQNCDMKPTVNAEWVKRVHLFVQDLANAGFRKVIALPRLGPASGSASDVLGVERLWASLYPGDPSAAGPLIVPSLPWPIRRRTQLESILTLPAAYPWDTSCGPAHSRFVGWPIIYDTLQSLWAGLAAAHLDGQLSLDERHSPWLPVCRGDGGFEPSENLIRRTQ